MDTETREQRIARLRAESVRQSDGTYRASCRVGAYRVVITAPPEAEPAEDALLRALQSAGDRRDWDECDRIEAEIDRLKDQTP